MRLESNEYSINGDSITISKETLLQWAEHYHNINMSCTSDMIKSMFYWGKEEVLLDLLKHFEQEA